MTYQHRWHDGRVIELPAGKAVCVGRNYAEHARELGNAVPAAPILFLKPSTALVPLQPAFSLPAGQGECHHETELTLLIGRQLSGTVTADTALAAVVGVGLGLDLTLREVQNQLKAQGYPWEVAKAFDGAAPLGPFVPVAELPPLDRLGLTLAVNGQRRQQGQAADMITAMVPLLQAIAAVFTLLPGDVVMTGTPAGVAALQPGDELLLTLEADRRWQWRTRVADLGRV